MSLETSIEFHSFLEFLFENLLMQEHLNFSESALNSR